MTEGSSFFLDVKDQASDKDRFHHHFDGRFSVLYVGKRTATTQLGEVVARVFPDRLVVAPKKLPTSDTIPHSATTSDMYAKNKKGREFSLKNSCTPREVGWEP